MVSTLLFLLFTATTAVASPNIIHLLKPHFGSGAHKHSDFNCLSWRLAVETNNLQNWTQVPQACEDYVGHYMLGKQYRHDCDFVAAEAYEYAKALNITGDGNDVWVFDIDETTLSNIPYYARDTVAFGAIPFNATSFQAWVAEGKAPAIPGALKLYKKLISLGFKIVFLTGTNDIYMEARIKNLKAAGYTAWEKLILKGAGEGRGVVFKSKKRKELEDTKFVGIWVINGAIYLGPTSAIGRLNFPIQCTTTSSVSWLHYLRFEKQMFQDSFKQTPFNLIKCL